MPVTYQWDGPLLKLELAGTYEPEDVIRQFEAALADPRAAEKVALLVDLSRSESIGTRNPSQIRLVAQALEPYTERIEGRCALVAPEDVQFGLSRMGSVYSESVGVEAEVFRSEEDALAWLGIKRHEEKPT